ncbi:glycosyltransferase [Devosia submarina]|uniref:glycosyltransferase n=1 Tax=Devosia submarina TaxID=1173082 RepID=UPI000D34D1DD|nr:glycosyltransferase [Devosia submarina]
MHANRKPSLYIEFNAGERTTVSGELPPYIRKLAPRQFRAETHVVGGKGWGAIGWYIFRTILMRRPDIVVSTEYRRSFLVNLALILSGSNAPHVVIGMNLSARPITSGYSMLQKKIDWVFARSSTIVVHSTREAELFAALHKLPIDRFVFSHWGYDLPVSESTRFAAVAKPYACMIGRNNRDLETFAKAVRLAGIRGIAVVPGYMQVDPELEQKLDIYRDLPMDDCIDCIRNAAINVTLLRDGERGAGHITVVTALHLGARQVHSNTDVLREYLPSKRFSIPVPIRDAAAVAEAMRMALEPEPESLSKARRVFAKKWLSHTRATERIAAILAATLEGRALPLTPPEWDSWLQHERSLDSEGDLSPLTISHLCH